MAQHYTELRSTIETSQGALIDHGQRHRAGKPTSASQAEGTVNPLVSARMNKRRQMRWPPRGAHRVLQVRPLRNPGLFRRRPPTRPGSPVMNAVIVGDVRREAKDIAARTARAAAAGFEALGVGSGDVVALCVHNDFAFLEASLGAGQVGAYITTLNWHS